MTCLDIPTEFDRMTGLVRLDTGSDAGPGNGGDFAVDLPDEL